MYLFYCLWLLYNQHFVESLSVFFHLNAILSTVVFYTIQGVQCADDALIAVERGLNGIVCSNHGGRQLDFARSGVEVLVEVMAALKAKGWEDRIEVYVDGGVRRGTDVLKALALGAKAVCFE